MKKLLISAIAVGVALLAASFTAPKADVTYKADPAATSIVWTGKKVTGQHTGLVKLAKGTLVSDGKSFKSGSFDIDVASMTTTDLTGEYADKLIGHLKSDDFFSTAKSPIATLVVTSFKLKSGNDYEATGKLTIKGITADITFPATIKTDAAGTVTADAIVKVDRTKYDIKYGSGKFFDNLGDKAIYDEFELAVKLVAKK
ncbi:MAG: YceI family protein [Cytophagales bacterium]|nr:YceI family protein [Cytophagales bacterium]